MTMSDPLICLENVTKVYPMGPRVAPSGSVTRVSRRSQTAWEHKALGLRLGPKAWSSRLPYVLYRKLARSKEKRVDPPIGSTTLVVLLRLSK